MAGYAPSDYGQLDYIKQQKIEQELAFSGQRGQVIGEFGKFVKAMMNEKGPYAEFQSFLLEMDDCQPTYSKGTLIRGSDTIEKPYVSLAGCMTIASIATSGKSGGEFWTDGFWPRFAFVCPPANFDLDCPFEPGDNPVPFNLYRPLAEWHNRLGIPEITITQKQKTNQKGENVPIEGQYDTFRGDLPETTVVFGSAVLEAWKRYRSVLKGLRKQMDTKDLKGNYDRFATKAMRIAALLASLENDGCIELWHWAKAQEICENWRLSLHRVYTQINGTATLHAKKLEDTIIAIFERKAAEGITELDARDLMRANFSLSKGTTEPIIKVLKNLKEANILDSVNGTKKYKLATQVDSKLALQNFAESIK
jgi:hypothetical protein